MKSIFTLINKLINFCNSHLKITIKGQGTDLFQIDFILRVKGQGFYLKIEAYRIFKGFQIIIGKKKE